MTLIIILIFASTVALVLGFTSLAGPRPIRRRLARLSNGSTAVFSAGDGEETVLAEDKHGRLGRALHALGGASAREQSEKTGILRERLIHAGYRRRSAMAVYMGSRIVLALVGPVIALSMAPFAWGLDDLRLMAILCGLSGFGYVAPSMWLDHRKRSRQGKIERGLPDALDLMVVCVEAGLGINASLQRVSEEFCKSNPVLSSEMELVTLEIRAGKPTTEALRGLADRTGVDDVSSLVALLVQTERFGTSVADALRVHADAMRVRRMQRAEERAGKAPLKMIFPTLLIFMAVLLVLLAPAILQFMELFSKQS
jgi:tight adherence protein C